MKILQLGSYMLHAERGMEWEADKRTELYDEDYRRFSQFRKRQNECQYFGRDVEIGKLWWRI